MGVIAGGDLGFQPIVNLFFEPANGGCTQRDFLRELAFLDKSVEMLASVINSLPVAEIADERAGKTAQAGFWDVAARKFHHGEPPAGTVRCLVRGEFELRLSTYGQPVKFQAGLNDVAAELLEHAYVQLNIKSGNLTVQREADQ